MVDDVLGPLPARQDLDFDAADDNSFCRKDHEREGSSSVIELWDVARD
jgi:hypothetical protein